MPQIRDIVLKKECDDVDGVHKLVKVDYLGGGEDDSSDKCSVTEYKHGLVKNVEPLIPMEPLKPWITLKIKGFDFAAWLKNTVSKNDFVVVKMDVEGTKFDLIPRLFETGAICLVDEIFLECHYNRWQRCCPGQRSAKYGKTYDQCLQLFNSLRQSGVLVHQWC
ncbi:hypothetical protein S245_066165 [Arachis hypogaea]